jgi:cell division septation protein DedD
MLTVAIAPLQAQSVKAGIDEWQRGNYANAVAIWRPLAEAGDANAQFNLGQAYRLGRGMPTNVSESRKWFERAAVQGHVDAETTLGLLLFQTDDQANALKWLKQAADQDEPRAMLVYGTALYNGTGVTQDPVLGYAYVRRSAAQGLGPAKETLAQLDQIMSAEERRKGAAMAESMSKAAGNAAFSSGAPNVVGPSKIAEAGRPKPAKAVQPAPKPVETASLEGPKKPAPRPANPVPAAAPATGHWRVQLGAFSQKGNAEALYRKLAGNGALAGRKPFYIAAGAVTRLQVGPFESKSAATAACKALGSACFPVPAK